MPPETRGGGTFIRSATLSERSATGRRIAAGEGRCAVIAFVDASVGWLACVNLDKSSTADRNELNSRLRAEVATPEAAATAKLPLRCLPLLPCQA